QCGDNDLAIKVLEGLIKIKSDHNIAKEMLNKLISGENQNSRLSGSTTIDKLNFPVTELSSKTNTDSRFERNVNCLIFSKDRAMQLQAAIESFRLHCKDSENVSITVLYKASSDKHKRQYQTLKKRFSDIEFTEETDFKKQTISLTQGSEYIMFMVDDNIFTCDFYIRDAVGALEAETDAAGFSLRLGKNTNYCYPRNANQALPDFSPIENGILKYDWTSAEYDFGYPLELSSSIYRARDIMPMIELIAFNNPNILEEAMAANSKLFARSKPQLLCFENSVTFCNPVNIVQTVYTNRAGKNPEHSAENLTEKFEQGYKIDIQRYSGLAVNACHQETELLLIQDTDRTITASKKRDQNIQPGFSIVMTVYNKENFISDAIESVLKQTFADWELIIVDDCSTDRSGEIICGYLSDNRIKFICNNINRGISASARIGIANGTSEYFGILDADDRLEPCALEIMHRQHVENPHCGLIYSQFTACDEKLNPIRNGFCAKIPKGNTAMEMDTVSHFKTFKACDYLKTTGLDENLAVAEDKDIIYKMEEVTHLKFIDEPLYLYREMRNPDIHADGNVNAGIMCRAKAKINAIKRRSDATAELMQIDPFVEFKKTLRAARQRHPEVDQYLELLQKLYQNNMLGNLSLPQNIESYSIEEKTQWLAANRYIDFKKAIDTLKNPKRENPQPLVTVDMVTYNGEKYIEKAIISVLSQTYRNFELLIIDDGSTDNTGKIIESYSDKRIRYIRQEHKNYAAGKNRAIKEANGEFILCVDSDDLIEPAYIEKMVAAALKHPEADYYYPETLYPLDEHGNLLGVKWKYNDYQDNRKLPALLCAHGFALIPNPGSLIRKSLYENVGLYDEVETVEDFVFLCKNASKINFKRVDEHCWYFYRRVPTGNSHRLKPRNKIMADALNEMVSIYGKEGLCPDIADIADPKLREKEYLKYIVDTFEKHSRNE
ncbi:MAG: glycosyltransferase, partial [Candidatus Brocadiia bacterium]